jgi:hypothetical protein
MAVKLYGVYLARFRFLEANTHKIRPVVIVSQPKGPHKIVLVIPLSSKTIKEDIDVRLKSWQASGLSKPTVARIHRLTAMLGENILEVIGELKAEDANTLKEGMRMALEL